MSRSVLVTGGAGYIGSHTVLQLLQVGFEALVKEMVVADLRAAERDQLCQREGFATFAYHE